MRQTRMLLFLVAPALVSAQGIGSLDLNALKQGVLGGQGLGSTGSTLPGPSNLPVFGDNQGFDSQTVEDQQRDFEIRMMKASERGPARFASDLFDVRQRGPMATDGGVSEDYVLGTGDQVYLNATGSAGFDLSTQVDGRGEITIPKLGSAKVGGLSLAQARAAVQRLVSRSYSRTAVDLQVVKLREIRISVLGEVYKPGAYLVPSLGSLVNVLSLAGGPTGVGSYRDIRVVRGGRVVFSLDLYPLRAEGLGNPNFALQSGDTVFVPLATDLVTVQGAFTRVVSQPGRGATGMDFLAITPEDERRNALVREYCSILIRLDPTAAQELPVAPTGGNDGIPMGQTQPGRPGFLNLNPAIPSNAAYLSLYRSQAGQGKAPAPAPAAAPIVDPALRRSLESRLAYIRNLILDLDDQKRADHRLAVDPVTQQARPAVQDEGKPEWLQRWEQTGKAPEMSFELKRGETLSELVSFAGGLVPEAGLGPIAIQSRSPDGRLEVASVRGEAAEEARITLRRGDIVSAAISRTTSDQMVQVEGWVRVPGTFARTEGLRVGDLLKQNQQALPDTYLHHGEIVRTLPDGTSQFFSFDVAQAMAGDTAQNLLLADRDRVELYRTDDLRIQKTVTLLGPVARPGVYAFHEGMRAADLIFRAGVPQKNADRFEAELAHSQDGKPSAVQKLDLSKLLSTDTASPVSLTDEAVNPLLLPDDQLSIFEKPGYKIHRTVLIQGQVAHPGSYALDHEGETLSELMARAGGLTALAMPRAGIFLRQVGQAGPDMGLFHALGGKGGAGHLDADDPASEGINEVLERLNETKRNPLSGQLLSSPLLHSLTVGDLSRLVVDFGKALKGDRRADVELRDGDTIIIPRMTDVAYVVGETASPFAAYKVGKGLTVHDLLRLAGGTTRNADTWNIRLLKADGRIVDSWVMRKDVEPGDTILVPQKIRRDTTWQENLQALTPLAIVLNTLK